MQRKRKRNFFRPEYFAHSSRLEYFALCSRQEYFVLCSIPEYFAFFSRLEYFAICSRPEYFVLFSRPEYFAPFSRLTTFQTGTGEISWNWRWKPAAGPESTLHRSEMSWESEMSLVSAKKITLTNPHQFSSVWRPMQYLTAHFWSGNFMYIQAMRTQTFSILFPFLSLQTSFVSWSQGGFSTQVLPE